MKVTDKIIGKIKPLNSVNNGPTGAEKNQRLYKEAGFPYSRNHDAAYATTYGREHTVDIQNIFRNFDADCNDDANYDFDHTDMLTKRTLDAGAKTFYRLGTSIEGSFIRHYGTVPPKDNHKWAVICEHIIRHLNEEKNFGIEYWEIWNEPEPWFGTDRNPNCWDGTPEQFYELYEVAAKHLKKAFPNIKIGGPSSISANIPWLEDFFKYCKEHSVPLDFFSWHIYNSSTDEIMKRAETMRLLLDKYGFTDTESILNEWNFEPKDEPSDVPKLYRARTNVGAAFVADTMLRCQDSSVDMLMYYDARPGTVYNGIFEFYTGEPFKAYYAFKSFSELYKSGNQLKVSDVPDGVHAVAAKADGAAYLMLSYYTDREEKPEIKIPLSFDGYKISDIYITDADRTNEEIGAKDEISLKSNSFALVKAVK